MFIQGRRIVLFLNLQPNLCWYKINFEARMKFKVLHFQERFVAGQ